MIRSFFSIILCQLLTVNSAFMLRSDRLTDQALRFFGSVHHDFIIYGITQVTPFQLNFFPGSLFRMNLVILIWHWYLWKYLVTCTTVSKLLSMRNFYIFGTLIRLMLRAGATERLQSPFITNSKGFPTQWPFILIEGRRYNATLF